MLKKHLYMLLLSLLGCVPSSTLASFSTQGPPNSETIYLVVKNVPDVTFSPSDYVITLPPQRTITFPPLDLPFIIQDIPTPQPTSTIFTPYTQSIFTPNPSTPTTNNLNALLHQLPPPTPNLPSGSQSILALLKSLSTPNTSNVFPSQPSTNFFSTNGIPNIQSQMNTQQIEVPPTPATPPQIGNAFEETEEKEEETWMPPLLSAIKNEPTNIHPPSSKPSSTRPKKKKPKAAKWPCPTCGKRLSTKETLKGHQRIHTGERPYTCSYCTKTFRYRSGLKEHISIHKGEKPFECIYCHKRFGKKWNYKVHLRIHTGEEPYQCNYCLRTFRQKNTCIIHIRTHTGEKPFQCTQCDKKCASRSRLNSHIKKNHPMSA